MTLIKMSLRFSLSRSSRYHGDAGYDLLDVSRYRVMLASERPVGNSLRCIFWDNRSPLLHSFSGEVSRRSLGADCSLVLLHANDEYLALRDTQDVRVRRPEQGLR